MASVWANSQGTVRTCAPLRSPLRYGCAVAPAAGPRCGRSPEPGARWPGRRAHPRPPGRRPRPAAPGGGKPGSRARPRGGPRPSPALSRVRPAGREPPRARVRSHDAHGQDAAERPGAAQSHESGRPRPRYCARSTHPPRRSGQPAPVRMVPSPTRARAPGRGVPPRPKLCRRVRRWGTTPSWTPVFPRTTARRWSGGPFRAVRQPSCTLLNGSEASGTCAGKGCPFSPCHLRPRPVQRVHLHFGPEGGEPLSQRAGSEIERRAAIASRERSWSRVLQNQPLQLVQWRAACAPAAVPSHC
ncbi:hypothetical protein EDD99_5355 [Streptomyces sp. 846.5]|nr:hypothetical protein EDD99_5355 [Streptomyces sp. 846.5]